MDPKTIPGSNYRYLLQQVQYGYRVLYPVPVRVVYGYAVPGTVRVYCTRVRVLVYWYRVPGMLYCCTRYPYAVRRYCGREWIHTAVKKLKKLLIVQL